MDNLLREVVMVAISYLLSQYKTLGLEKDFNKKYTIHVNMIPGGILKSGVSAGLSVVLALISALTNREIRCDTSALGEITLHGKVKKVIGVHEKILGASRLGLKRIIFSRENAQDIERLPQEIRADLELLCVTTITEAAHYTFQ
jgi:ATP-dependent Lon protease